MDKLFIKYKEIITYIFFGVLTTLVSWGSYSLFENVCHLSVFLSNLFSWILAVAFAFVTNKLWVFDSKTWNIKTVLREAATFVSSRLLTGVIEIVSVPLLVKVGADGVFTSFLKTVGLGYNFLMTKGMCSKILVSVIVLILNYVFSKLFVFRKGKEDKVMNKQSGEHSNTALSDILFIIANVITAVLMLAACVGALIGKAELFGDGSSAASLGMIGLFAAVLCFVILYFYKRFINSGHFELKYRLSVFMLFAALIAVQLFLIKIFDVKQIADAFVVRDQALAIANGRMHRIDAENVFFQTYTGNGFTLALTFWFYRLLCIAGANLQSSVPFALVNSVFIDASIFLAMHAVKRVFSKKHALGFLFFSVINPTTYLFIYWSHKVVYSLPIIAIAVYLISLCKDLPRDRRISRGILYSLIGALGAVTLLVNPAALAPIAAAAVIAVFKWQPSRKELLKDAAVVLCALAFTALAFAGADAYAHKFIPSSGRELPIAYNIMAGLNEDGVATDSDFEFVNGFGTTDEMKTAATAEIKDRFSAYSTADFAKHLFNKLALTWGKGDSGYTQKLFTDTKQTRFYTYICGDRAGVLIAYCYAFRLVILLAAAAGLMTSLKKKKQDTVICFASITVGLAMLFYLVSDTAESVCIPFIPFILLLSSEFTDRAEKRIDAANTKNVMRIGFAALAVTLAAGVALYSPVTDTARINTYAINCECSNSPLYNNYITDLSESGGKLTQEFYTQKKFNKIKLNCSKADGNAKYKIKIADGQGNVIAKVKVKRSDVKHHFISVKFDLQKPTELTYYKITVTPVTEGKKDSIIWHSKKMTATDQCAGQCYLSGVKKADMNIRVLRSYKSRYMPKKMYIAVFGGVTALELTALYTLAKPRRKHNK